MPILPGQDATQIVTNNGLRTQYGVIIPPGAKLAAYVRSTGVQSTDDAYTANNLVTTVAQGLARVRPGLGDFVVCLPGHAEIVADGTTFSGALVAGAKVVGVGRGGNMPTIFFSAVASQWLVNKADVVIAGLRLASPTAAQGFVGNSIGPLTVTAADCGIYYNEFVVASAGGQFITATMQLQAGADRADVSGNVFRGAVNGGSGSAITVTAAIADARICDNEMAVACQAGGNIAVSAAATGLKILRNVINNTTAASVVAISFTNVAVTGQCAYNTMTVLSTGGVSPGVTGITVGGTNNLIGFFQNFCVNDPNKSGLLVPVVDT